MGEDDALDEKHSLALLGLDTNAIVYEDGAGGRSREKLLLRWSRAHDFLACSISTDSKSGQFKVRTQEGKKPYRLRPRRVGHLFAFRSCRIGNSETDKLQTQKADSLRSAPPLSKNLSSGHFLGVCQEI
jgi:hypothetical protein